MLRAMTRAASEAARKRAADVACASKQVGLLLAEVARMLADACADSSVAFGTHAGTLGLAQSYDRWLGVERKPVNPITGI